LKTYLVMLPFLLRCLWTWSR